MGRRWTQKQKNALKEKHIEYGVSEGQRGRNPAPPPTLKRVRDIGYKSLVPGQQSVVPASSSNHLSPVYPAPFVNFSWQGFEVTEYLQPGTVVIPSKIVAANLVSLVLHDPAADEETRARLDPFFKALIPRRLTRARISLTGKSKKEYDPTIYEMLGRAKNALTRLCLELSFFHKPALQSYLSSTAASRLVSLELKTNSNVLEQVLYALQNEDSARLPNLQHLCLKIKKVDVSRLLAALEKRRGLGSTPALRVEIRNDIDDATRTRARAIGITFDKPCPMRFGS